MNKTVVLILTIVSVAFYQSASAQLIVKHNYSPDQLVRQKLIGEFGGIKITGTSYHGSRYSIAYFMNQTPCFESKSGIILSTGYAYSAASPNKSGNMGGSMGEPGNRMLNQIVNNRTNDAATLHIDFISYTDSIFFNYFFGSEEYPEYINKGVNDIFAFFVKQKSTGKIINIAHLPDGTPVTVDHINHKKNKDYYVENKMFFEYNFDKFKDNRKAGFLAQEFSYDGFTKELTAGIKVIPYEEYELIITIADVGDDLYDSGVFLEAGSFKAANYTISEIDKMETKIEELKKPFGQKIALHQQKDALVIESRIEFDFNKYNINPEYSDFLNNLSKILKKEENIELQVHGHTDSIGNETYNQELSLKRALSIANHLTINGVSRHRIKCKGFGSKQPAAEGTDEESRSKNRRVEFIIIKKNVKTF